MKKIHFTSLIIGLVLGVILSTNLPFSRQAHAAEDGIPVAEVDKKLVAILAAQEQLKKKIEDITTQTQFLKAASGK